LLYKALIFALLYKTTVVADVARLQMTLVDTGILKLNWVRDTIYFAIPAETSEIRLLLNSEFFRFISLKNIFRPLKSVFGSFPVF
jgi:hypothetical protein